MKKKALRTSFSPVHFFLPPENTEQRLFHDSGYVLSAFSPEGDEQQGGQDEEISNQGGGESNAGQVGKVSNHGYRAGCTASETAYENDGRDD